MSEYFNNINIFKQIVKTLDGYSIYGSRNFKTKKWMVTININNNQIEIK